MLHLLLTGSGDGIFIPNSGPGDKHIIAGNRVLGFFGELSEEELFSASELSALTEVMQGTLNESKLTWLKYSYQERILFIPRVPIRRNVSWFGLYTKGVVYGTDDDGPLLREGPANQYRVVQKDDHRFMVRLLTGDEDLITGLTGSGVDPTTEPTDVEWTQLLYSSVSKAIASKPPSRFPTYPENSFGLSATGDWVREQSADLSQSLVRGASSQIDRFNLLNVLGLANWRPVLELITTPEPLLRPLGEAGSVHGLEPLYDLKTDFHDVPNPIITPAIDITYDSEALWSVFDVGSTDHDVVRRPIDITYETNALWAPHSLNPTPIVEE